MGRTQLTCVECGHAPSPALCVAPESWLGAGVAEVERYESGRRKLAVMMGGQADTFFERDVSDALRYLLPTRLTAPDALPLLKVQ